MESIFKTWKTNRQIHLGFLEKYTIEQLNKVPIGFSNNLIWNIGHIIVAQQALIYKSSDLPGYVSEELFELYKPGTKPTEQTTEDDVKELKTLLISLIEKTEEDFYKKKFKTFNKRTTAIGFELDTLRDAFEFNNYHEALHLGFMINIQKFV